MINKTISIGALLLAAASASYEEFAEGSESRDLKKLHGNIAAAFTPVNQQGDLDFTNLPKMAARLQEWGIPNVMVGGTTGESLSFTHAERVEVVKEWLKIADQYDINVYVHTGMDSVQDAKKLTQEVAAMDGVKGIFSMCPVYFKPSSIDNLVDTMAVVASGAPDLPFWYYHFPAKTGVDMSMYEFIKAADESEKIPNLMGIKFTNEILMDFNAMGNYKSKKYNNLMGRDEILTSALVTGVCDGGVGSTINFMSFNADLSHEWDNPHRDMDKITSLQLQTVGVIEKWLEVVPVLNVQKSILKMTGIDFGPMRLPQQNLSHDQEMQLGTALSKLGVNITSEYILPDENDIIVSEMLGMYALH